MTELKPGWKMVKFGDVVRQCKESVDRDNNPFERYLEGGHMDSEDIHIYRWGEFGVDYVGPAFHRIFRKRQVLYGSRRTYLKKVAMADFDGITSNTTFVCETKNQNVFMQELLPFLMLADSFTEHSIRESKGSTNPYINWPDIAKYEFPLPPIDQQKRIAEILWAADEAVEKYVHLLKDLNLYAETLIEKNLTSTDSGGVLGDYCPSDGIKIGPFGSLLHAKDYQSEGIPVVMPADIEGGVIQEEKVARIDLQKADELRNYKLRENDILFPRRGDLTKRAIVLKHQENWLCGTGTIRVRLTEGINTRAVFWALTSASTNRWLERFSVGTTMLNLNASTIKKIPFHIPKGTSSAALIGELERVMDVSLSAKEHCSKLVNLRKKLVEQMVVEGAAHV